VKEGKMERFIDRRDAGRVLARKLAGYAGQTDVIVLALPRGGVPVAYEVAIALNVPLDIFLVRKLGVPGREELAFGAIASGGVRVLNNDIVRALNIPEEVINIVARNELQELQRREHTYRGESSAPDLRDRQVILIDDGLATGASMRAAVVGVRTQHAARIIIAIPAAAPELCDAFHFEVDEMVCVMTPEPFYGLSRWYEDFSQTTDEEVQIFLKDANHQLLHG
jgi:putative phosphoribosyl transferase